LPLMRQHMSLVFEFGLINVAGVETAP
jgi:hypothetical protein